MLQKRLSFLIILVFLIGNNTFAQQLFSGDGSIEFDSNAPLELIQAESKQLKGGINTLTNKFAFMVKVTSFDGFNNDLQKDHFNENYMESDRYPKASFVGKIIEKIDFDIDGTHNVRAKGKLTIHGIEQIRIVKSKLVIKNGIIMLSTKFKIPLSDHNISIPKLVNKKIATEIDVMIETTLKKK